MSTSTLQNFRVGSDLTVKVRLKDGGVAIDWSTLSGIRAVLYSDAQSSIAGRCDVTVDGEDPTLLVCRYAATKMQYLGVNRIVVSTKYMGETKTYDKPAFTFVRWTADQDGEQITIKDPEVTVEITVEDISSSILQEAVNAAFSAADRAEAAAQAAEHMVDIKTGPAGKSPYKGENGNWFEWDEEAGQYVDTGVRAKGDTGDTPDISIGTVTTVEPGEPARATMTGTPEAPVLNLSIPKGAVGSTPNISIGTVTTGAPGTPVVITITGTAEAPVLNVTIPQGMKGDTGVSADYPITIYNGLDSDATDAALSAAQGKVLDGKISQLRQKVTTSMTGVDTSLTLDYISSHNNPKVLWEGVKSATYFDPNSDATMYFRLAGFYTDHIQITLTADHATMVDFKVENISSRPTGVKTYNILNGDKELRIVIDWDKLVSNFADPVSTDFWIIDIPSFDYTHELSEKIDDVTSTTTEQVGEGVGTQAFNFNKIYCPNKQVKINGYLSEIGFNAGADCTLTIYIGELDQRYLFIPRSSHTFVCTAGTNVLNVESQKIPVYDGEYIAFQPSTGGVMFDNGTLGDPLAENSFLYSVDAQNPYQLQAYGTQRIFKVKFYAKVVSDCFIQQKLESLKLQTQVSAMGETLGSLSFSIGLVDDGLGNKYRLKVVNGAIVPIPLNFRNVLCVGNSFTVHPTTTDTGAAFATAYWWGHWAMAASSPNVAWPKLLQNTLRIKQSDAVVTPIFGRPYETGAYNLTDNDAFVYWDNGTRKSLKANLASFSGVDCIVFFLGDNYTGNDWETKYNAMCEQFATWFPSASIYCVGAVQNASVSTAIQNVANAKGYPYIDVLGIKTLPLRSREGNFVLGDDNNLHQIDFSSVGNHFGDYGQLKLNEKISTALGASPIAVSYAVTLESQLLSLSQYNYLEDSIVSIFADVSVNSILVVDSSNNAITATSHSTDYGKIFTFTMPASDVSVSVASSHN